MTTVAVLPIKRFERAKQRLDAVPERPALAAEMARRVLAALSAARGLAGVLVVTGDAAARALAAEHGAQVVEEPELLGHSAAARLGVARASDQGARRVLLVPGDCPLLEPHDVDGLLERHPRPGVVVVPDHHGTGTNALLLQPPGAIAPAFGPGSCERHVALARAAGCDVVVDAAPAGLVQDVDTPDDLAAVRARGA